MDEIRAAISNWLDPQLIGELLLTWSGKILAALAIFVIGRLIAKALSGWFNRGVQRVGLDQTLARFLSNLMYIGLLVFVVLTAVNTLGVPTTNFLAIVGAAGLAIGLALKDSLANFSSGVMLVFFRPFKVGDNIQAAGVAGVVESIGMFSTEIKTADNAVIIVPNSLIYSGTITNFTAERTRRIDLTIAISYDDDLAAAKEAIRDVIDGEKRVHALPAPEIVVADLTPNGVNIAVRVWVATADHAPARSDLLERIMIACAKRGMTVPYQRLRILDQTARVG
jgi:small conductance mechanosensitive channel